MIYKIRNAFIIYLLILIAFILQSTVFARIIPLGCSPNLILILTFTAGYSRGKLPGMFLGFFAGLCFDIFFCDVLGLNALILSVIGYLSGVWRKLFYSEHILAPLSFIALSDLFYCFAYYFARFALRGRFDFGYYFVHIILPDFLLTILAAVIIYVPLTKLNARLSVDV